jgi:hypothetical protein
MPPAVVSVGDDHEKTVPARWRHTGRTALPLKASR